VFLGFRFSSPQKQSKLLIGAGSRRLSFGGVIDQPASFARLFVQSFGMSA
jgi:hypothetical protein